MTDDPTGFAEVTLAEHRTRLAFLTQQLRAYVTAEPHETELLKHYTEHFLEMAVRLAVIFRNEQLAFNLSSPNDPTSLFLKTGTYGFPTLKSVGLVELDGVLCEVKSFFVFLLSDELANNSDPTTQSRANNVYVCLNRCLVEILTDQDKSYPFDLNISAQLRRIEDNSLGKALKSGSTLDTHQKFCLFVGMFFSTAWTIQSDTEDTPFYAIPAIQTIGMWVSKSRAILSKFSYSKSGNGNANHTQPEAATTHTARRGCGFTDHAASAVR